MNVLVVEDDPFALRALCRLIGRDGDHVLLPCFDVAEAAAAIRSNIVDVAIIDFRLPDGTALDVLDVLEERRPDVPAAVITGGPTSPLLSEVIGV